MYGGGVIQSHPDEFLSGLYFKNYPELPLTERSYFFKYKESARTDQIADIISNMSHHRVAKVIETTYDVDFQPESYVLLGNEFYRIIAFNTEEINQQSATIVKKRRTNKILTLTRVSNAIGMER